MPHVLRLNFFQLLHDVISLGMGCAVHCDLVASIVRQLFFESGPVCKAFAVQDQLLFHKRVGCFHDYADSDAPAILPLPFSTIVRSIADDKITRSMPACLVWSFGSYLRRCRR